MINEIRSWIMKTTETNLLGWQKRYGTEEAWRPSPGATTLAGRVPLPAMWA